MGPFETHLTRRTHNILSSTHIQTMKLLLVFTCLVVAYAEFSDDAGDTCLGSTEAHTCFKSYVACRNPDGKKTSEIQCSQKFDKCLQGDCPKKCKEAWRLCGVKPGVSDHVIKCHAERKQCQEDCRRNMFQ